MKENRQKQHFNDLKHVRNKQRNKHLQQEGDVDLLGFLGCSFSISNTSLVTYIIYK